jgi:hypothetical protein
MSLPAYMLQSALPLPDLDHTFLERFAGLPDSSVAFQTDSPTTSEYDNWTQQ